MSTSTASRASDQVRRRAIQSDNLVRLGRAGWVAKGVVYGVVGVLAVGIALSGGSSSGGGSGGESASQEGALAEIASTGWGGPLLWVLALGLLGYALWRFLTAVLPSSGEDGASEWVHRVAYAASGVLYLTLAWTAVSIATGGSSSGGSGGGGQESTVERLSGTLIEQGWGRWLLALVGLGVLGYAVHQAHRGITHGFDEDLDLSGASSGERTLVERLGVAGHVGRGLVAALVGVFLVRAAITADPEQVNGLDASLREVAGSGLGTLLVLVTALGLLAYGAFAALSARHQVLSGP